MDVRGLALGFLGALSLSACSVGDRVRLVVDGSARNYYLVVPETLAKPAPLLLMLHGGGTRGSSKGRRLGASTGLAELALDRGFVAAFPSSEAGNWNDGRERTTGAALSDDVGFLLSVIDDAAERSPVDPEQVVIAGISNGAFMTQRMICEHADRFVAGISVIGTMPAPLACTPSAPVPVRFVLGTADPLVPYAGGEVANGERGEALAADEALGFWATHNGCSTTVTEQVLPDLDPNDGSTATLRSYDGCVAPVSEVRLDGAGHTWPGGAQGLPESTIGSVNHDVQGAALVWDFAAPLLP